MSDRSNAWLQEFDGFEEQEKPQVLLQLVRRLQEKESGKEILTGLADQIQGCWKRDFLKLLPMELVLMILSYLSPRDLCRVARVSKAWHEAVCHDRLWKRYCEDENVKIEYPLDPSLSLFWKDKYKLKKLTEASWAEGGPRRVDSSSDDSSGHSSTQYALPAHHGHVITCIQFFPDSAHVLTASNDSYVRLWSLLERSCVGMYSGHQGGVWCCDGNWDHVVSGSTDHTVRMWETKTGRGMHVLTGHTATVRCVKLCPPFIVSSSRDTSVRLWEGTSGACLHVFTGPTDSIRCLQVSATSILCGSYDGSIFMWDIASKNKLLEIHGHTDRIYSLKLLGDKVVSGGRDQQASIWDVHTGHRLRSFHGGWKYHLTGLVEVSPRHLAAACLDASIRVWPLPSGSEFVLRGHRSPATCMTITGPYLISSCEDGMVKLWDLEKQVFVRNVLTFVPEEEVIWQIAATSSCLVCTAGKRLVSHSTSSNIHVVEFRPASL